MSIKIITIDVDGTLHNSEHKLTKKTIEVVKQALSQNVQIVVTTGRPFPGVVPIIEELGISGDDHYVITFNGATVQTASGKVISKSEINRDDFKELEDFAYKISHKIDFVHFQTETNEFAETTNHKINPWALLEDNLVNLPIRIHDGQSIPDDIEIIKPMFNGPKEQLDDIQSLMPNSITDKINMLRGAAYNLEFVSKEASKGNGLKQLAEQLGVDLTETMAIGDQGNDLSMLKVAGTAVAMGNAIDELKNIADFITEDNDHDGVALAIEKYVLKATN